MKLYDPFQGRMIVLLPGESEENGREFVVTYDFEAAWFEIWDLNPTNLVQREFSPRPISSPADAHQFATEWIEKGSTQ